MFSTAYEFAAAGTAKSWSEIAEKYFARVLLCGGDPNGRVLIRPCSVKESIYAKCF
jgi:hypothetical protein